MNGGLNRLVAAAFVAGVVVFATPTAALACSGGPSAYNVYHECVSNGGSGGGGHKGGGGGGSRSSTPTGGSHSSSSSSSSSGSRSTVSPAVSAKAKKALNQSGQDKNALKQLYNSFGKTRFLSVSHAHTAASEPTAIGSAFDLGTGPTALLIALAGTAVLLLAMTGVRGARRRH